MSGGAITLVVIGVLVVLGFGVYLSSTAGRLDRLHKRIDSSDLSLDAHLLRRSSVALELATSGWLDPATSIVLAQAAHGARLSADDDPALRAAAESELTDALAVALDADALAEVMSAPGGRQVLEELDASCRRVELSRRFHNDAVQACRQLRDQGLVRVFRLAGHTPWPQTVELDDAIPEGLREAL